MAIVDASNLERNLYLTTQALELGVPVVVALNMIDVAERQGISIDVGRCQQHSACRSCRSRPTRAAVWIDSVRPSRRQRRGAAASTAPSFPEAFEAEVGRLRHDPRHGLSSPSWSGGCCWTWAATRNSGWQRQHDGVLEHERPGGPAAAGGGRLSRARPSRPEPATAGSAQVTAGCVERPAQRPVTWTDRLDRVLTHALWGTLVFLVLMFLVFQSIFTWASPLMELIDDGKDRLAATG